MSEQLPEVVVVVEPPLPDINVTVEATPPAVEVVVSDIGLPGPPGPVADISAHVNAENPHPNYDSGKSLLTRYRNAKV